MKVAPLIEILILSIPKDWPDESFCLNSPVKSPVLLSFTSSEFKNASVHDVSKSWPFWFFKKFKVPFAIEDNLPIVFCPPDAVKIDLGTKSASKLTYIT